MKRGIILVLFFSVSWSHSIGEGAKEGISQNVPKSAPPFTTEEIKQLIKERLQTKVSFSGDFEVNLANSALSIPKKTIDDQLQMGEVSLNDSQFTFEALVKVISGDQETQLPSVRGRIQPLIEIPVFTRPIAPGEEIAEADLTWQKIPSIRLSQTFLMRQQDIIGKTAGTRVLQPGQPILKSDIKAIVVVKKGEIVTVRYQTNGLYLGNQAEALQDAGIGDTIRFLPINSKKEIVAKVVGPSEAEIRVISMTQYQPQEKTR